MKTSESIIKIAPALLKAQKAMGAASKDAANPFFKSKYADYGAVLEACKEPLNANGILVLQPHTTRDGNSFVETLLIHESGEWISSETPIICKAQNDPQALGSAITYARRYGLQSLVSLPAEDDDGNGAAGKDKPNQHGASMNKAEQFNNKVAASMPPVQQGAPIASKKDFF